MDLFTVGQETTHRIGDPACAECWEEYPEACSCGGLIHAAGGEEEDEDGNVLLTTRCDRCGCSEDQVSQKVAG